MHTKLREKKDFNIKNMHTSLLNSSFLWLLDSQTHFHQAGAEQGILLPGCHGNESMHALLIWLLRQASLLLLHMHSDYNKPHNHNFYVCNHLYYGWICSV